MPNMPIYTQQTAPSGSMPVQMQAVQTRDPWGDAIQDVGKGIQSFAQNMAQIQEYRIKEANRLQTDKDEIWAASTASDIRVKATKRLRELSETDSTDLTGDIEKEIDGMLSESWKGATDQQKKRLLAHTVPIKTDMLTSAIGIDAARNVARTEADLEKQINSAAQSVGMDPAGGPWTPMVKAEEAAARMAETVASIDRANTTLQRKIELKQKLGLSVADAYMGRLIDTNPGLAQELVTGKAKGGPLDEVMKQIPASTLDSYRAKVETKLHADAVATLKAETDAQKSMADNVDKMFADAHAKGVLSKELIQSFVKVLDAPRYTAWMAKLETDEKTQLKDAKEELAKDASEYQARVMGVEQLKNEGKTPEEISKFVNESTMAPELKRKLLDDVNKPSLTQAAITKAVAEVKDEHKETALKMLPGAHDDILDMAALMTREHYRKAGITSDTEVHDQLRNTYAALKRTTEIGGRPIMDFPRPSGTATIRFDFRKDNKKLNEAYIARVYSDLKTLDRKDPNFMSRELQLRYIVDVYNTYYSEALDPAKAQMKPQPKPAVTAPAGG